MNTVFALLTARAGELAMLMLRLADGLNFEVFTQRTGRSVQSLFGATIDRIAKIGLIDVDPVGVRLTESGVNVADSVAAEFLNPVG